MTKQRAKIVQAIEMSYISMDEIAAMEINTPIMELEDGRKVPAYQCDRYTPVGMEGWAQLDIERQVWTFTPDDVPVLSEGEFVD